MKSCLLAAAVFCAGPATAGPVGSADTHAAPATGFPAAYLGMVELSLQADPAYGSRLLDSFELHLRSVAAMTAPRAVADYLELTVLGAGAVSAAELQSSLGREAMDPQRAAAILLAHALARPAQFHELLGGLEARRAGLGKHAAQLLREVKGAGDKSLIRLLRSQGERNPRADVRPRARFGKLDNIFDGVRAEERRAAAPSNTPRSGETPQRD